MKEEIYKCDMFNCKNEVMDYKQVQIQVIFNTEDPHKLPIKPSLKFLTVDICLSCMKKILAGNCVFGNKGIHDTIYVSDNIERLEHALEVIEIMNKHNK